MIYVTHFKNYNLAEIKEVDEVVNIFEGKVNPFDIPDLIRTAEEKLINFNTDTDQVLIAGSPIFGIVTYYVLVKYFPKRTLKILLHDAKTGHYNGRELPLAEY
jgi:hypothetical protein